jgi:heptosyltransferase-2/heptosyltransferase-3
MAPPLRSPFHEEQITSEAERSRLARQHLTVLGRSGQRLARERVRLKFLQAAGTRYRNETGDLLTPPRRILVIRPDHLGDLLFTTPALHLLRQQFPAAGITALTGPWASAVVENHPDLDEVLTCDFPGFGRRPKGSPWAPYSLLRREAQRLTPLGFDLALILRFDHWWGAWLAASAGIPRRIGYRVPETAPFLTDAQPYLAGRHEVLQNLALVLAAGPGKDRETHDATSAGWRTSFPVPAEDEARAKGLLAEAGATGRLVALHPGSGAAVKRWRTGAWIALAVELVRRHGVRIVLTGSAGEAQLIDPILAGLSGLSPRPMSLAGRTTLGALAAIYRRCDLVVGPDSGPLHLAVAVGVPTVHLYGPVDRRTFGPWGNPKRHPVIMSNWACAPCNRLDWPGAGLAEHGCLRDITVEQVLAEASRFLTTPSGELRG